MVENLKNSKDYYAQLRALEIGAAVIGPEVYQLIAMAKNIANACINDMVIMIKNFALPRLDKVMPFDLDTDTGSQVHEAIHKIIEENFTDILNRKAVLFEKANRCFAGDFSKGKDFFIGTVMSQVQIGLMQHIQNRANFHKNSTYLPRKRSLLEMEEDNNIP